MKSPRGERTSVSHIHTNIDRQICGRSTSASEQAFIPENIIEVESSTARGMVSKIGDQFFALLSQRGEIRNPAPMRPVPKPQTPPLPLSQSPRHLGATRKRTGHVTSHDQAGGKATARASNGRSASLPTYSASLHSMRNHGPTCHTTSVIDLRLCEEFGTPAFEYTL